MIELFKLYLRLALLRASPAQAPAGWLPVAVAGAAALVGNVVVSGLISGPRLAAGAALVELLLSAAFLAAVLQLCGHAPRLAQSLGSLYGAGAAMSVMVLPWALAVAGLGDGERPRWVGLSQLAILLWSLMIWARVLRLAAELSQLVAALLALAYLWLALVALQAVLG